MDKITTDELLAKAGLRRITNYEMELLKPRKITPEELGYLQPQKK